MERVRRWRSGRESEAVALALEAVGETALGDANLLPPMKEALRVGATLGEVSDALRRVFGEHRP
ncbi:MAG: methylmalonyl-CoA mutase family protein [Pyrinomonadaceae bacterium]